MNRHLQMKFPMGLRQHRVLWVTGALVGAALLAAGLTVHASNDKKDNSATKAAPSKPALTVQVTQAVRSNLVQGISANGNIAAWQEASVGSEVNGLRLAEVRANVGDRVQKGQVLAVFAPETVRAEQAQVKANLAEAEATLAEAIANAQRARDLQATGALSAQQINQYLTQENTAKARLEAVKASAQVQLLRVQQTEVRAPDAGIIAARSATVGAVMSPGQELFRMIRQGRLEWRAEVAAADLPRITPGMVARLTPAGGGQVQGRVRMVAPTVDPQSRNGIVYVDMPNPGSAKAGMFAKGEFEAGSSAAMTLPQTAVLPRDGFAYVFTVGADSRVSQVKVGTGRRVGDRVEVTSGLAPEARVVASGGGFLADGDLVRVVASVAGAASSGASIAGSANASVAASANAPAASAGKP